MAKVKVRGHCPRGCGEKLFVDESGYLFCDNPRCPQPDAAHQLLMLSRKFMAFVRNDARVLMPIKDDESGNVSDTST